jgi:dienelactone hydrolase
MRIKPLICALLLVGGCSSSENDPAVDAGGDAATSTSAGAALSALPAGAEEAEARLAASPRHGEWVTVRTGPADSVRAWVVYPERSDPAPVVLVVHEIFGLSHWVRAVADQLAADGFIAIAPDLLTMNNIPPGADGAPDADVARQQIGALDRDVIHRQLIAVADYGMALPAATDSYGIVGFCWGGTASFEHAIYSPELGASVVYYGSTPDTTRLNTVSPQHRRGAGARALRGRRRARERDHPGCSVDDDAPRKGLRERGVRGCRTWFPASADRPERGEPHRQPGRLASHHRLVPGASGVVRGDSRTAAIAPFLTGTGFILFILFILSKPPSR